MTSTIGQNIQKLANSVWSEARGIPVPDDPMQEAPQTEKKKLTLDEAIKNQEDVIQNQSVKPREPAQGPLNIG